MKLVTRQAIALLSAIVAGGAASSQAQTQPSVQAPSGQKTLAATINVYVFPNAGQDAARQSKDEAQCYSWAVTNTGSDPFQLAKQAEQIQQQGAQAQQQAAQAGKGAGAKGAVGGAAVGALIGEIGSNDAGGGAAAGAAVGVVAGRRRARHAQAQASSQAAAQTSQAMAATEEQILNFKKAFSVCLEASKYMVKY
jgi:archaellum component FlaG (FlaF/FlaG flagellin family)